MSKLVSCEITKSHEFERGPVDEYQLSTGSRFIYHQTKAYAASSLRVYVLAGSMHEEKSEEGMAHCLEHMVFKCKNPQTGNYYPIDMEKLGADVNAYTTKEYTCFEVNALSSRMLEIFPLLLEMVFNGDFKKKEFVTEKRVIAQEIREDRDDYEILAQEKTFEAVYPRYLGHGISGTLAGVNSFTLENLQSFFSKHYRLDNTIICLCTKDPVKRYLKKLERLNFSGLDKAKSQKRGFKSGLAKMIKEENQSFNWKPKSLSFKRKAEMAQVILAYPGPSCIAPNRFAFYLLSAFLTDGMSSHLYNTLREQKGLVYSVSSQIYSYKSHGHFEIHASCQKVKMKEVKQGMIEGLELVREEGIGDAKLAWLKESYLDYAQLVLDDLDERNEIIAHSLMAKKNLLDFNELSNAMNKVDQKILMRIAKEMLAARPVSCYVTPT